MDAAAFGVIANLIEVPIDSAISRHGRGLPNLVAYCKRMRDRFFSDLEAS
jgi:hypothetical protein